MNTDLHKTLSEGLAADRQIILSNRKLTNEEMAELCKPGPIVVMPRDASIQFVSVPKPQKPQDWTAQDNACMRAEGAD